ncbi:MAG TPA: PAS domain-containing protein [Capsulimonadaceae bacterium]|jgi:transcriptional regulator with PAS, ATPase and Fis domain
MSEKCLWEMLWDHDPNLLIVVDKAMKVRVVNAAFCRIFMTTAEAIVGTDASEIFGDLDAVMAVWNDGEELVRERDFPEHEFYARQVIFAIKSEGVIACVMVDLTAEKRQRMEVAALQAQTIDRVTEVVDNQMKVAQEIAGLLGEATAATKVSLINLVKLVEQGDGTGGLLP